MLARNELQIPCLQSDGTPGMVALIDVSPCNHGQWLPGDVATADKVPPDDYNTLLLTFHFAHAAWYSSFAGPLHWVTADPIPNQTIGQSEVNPDGLA